MILLNKRFINVSASSAYADRIVKDFKVNTVCEMIGNEKDQEFLRHAGLKGSRIFEGEKYYIGKNGKLTKISLVENQFDLPQVFGNFQVNELLKLHKILNLHNIDIKKIQKYYYFKSNRWDIEYGNNTIVMLPSFNLEKSLKNYKSFIKSEKIRPGQIIDLRVKNKIIVSNAEK